MTFMAIRKNIRFIPFRNKVMKVHNIVIKILLFAHFIHYVFYAAAMCITNSQNATVPSAFL